jgi:hypothetical protein
MITVWEFRSVDGKQVVRAVRPLWPDDLKFVHEYQTIIFRGSRFDWKQKNE